MNSIKLVLIGIKVFDVYNDQLTKWSSLDLTIKEL